MSKQKRTVKVVFNDDNYNLIRAIVIVIAYRERMKKIPSFYP